MTAVESSAELLAVIIPYYQKETKLLRAAIESVLMQEVPENLSVLILVIDDESPCPAEDSLDGIEVSEPFKIEVIKKANGGAASARNTGLDLCEKNDVQYVAFLDSDDRWLQSHICDGIAHLRREAVDLWFADSYDNGHLTSFSFQKYMTSRHSIGVPGREEVGQLEGREIFSELIKDCLPHTSTVIYNFRKHANCRFDENLKIAGEDHLFWISIAYNSKIFQYTTAIRGIRDVGISIFRNSLSWDSPEILRINMYQYLLRRKLEKHFRLNFQEKSSNGKIRNANAYFLFFLSVRNFLKMPVRVARVLIETLLISPTFPMHVVAGALDNDKRAISD